MQEKLAAIRSAIDTLDDQIVPLLAKRIDLAMEASRHKRTAEEVRGCDRVQKVLDSVAARARRADGHVDAIVEIYAHVIQTLTHMQLRSKGMADQ